LYQGRRAGLFISALAKSSGQSQGLRTQWGGEDIVVILINRFQVHTSGEKFEEVFMESTQVMRCQPGFIRFRLVKSLRHPDVYLNVAEWEDAASHMRAVQSETFQEHIRTLAEVAEADPDLHSIVYEYPDGESPASS
jgi:quinol monooxygenase YgiN